MIRIETGGGILSLRALEEGAARVRFAPEGAPESPSLALTETLPELNFEVEEGPASVALVTAKMRLVFDRASEALVITDKDGRKLLAEIAGSRRCVASEIQGLGCYAVEQGFDSPPDERIFGSGQFQDGHLNIRDLPRRLTQVNSQIAVPFLMSSKGYGLLWHNNGFVDLNPADGSVELSPTGPIGEAVTVEVTTAEGTQTETRQAMGFAGKFTVVKAGRYAMLFDIGRKMARRHYVEIDGRVAADAANFWLPPTASWFVDLEAGEHCVRVEAEGEDKPSLYMRAAADATVLRSPVAEALDYVVFAGSPDAVIASYRRLTGPAPLLPDWAFGYIHCRERFKTQAELLENAEAFRDRALPMDCIVQDWQYWGRHGWNAMRFDAADYPDPAAMVKQLHAMHARLMLSVWSKIDPGSELGKEFAARGYYIEGTEWVDFFNPAAADFYWSNFSEKLLSLGIDAWWQDATEPENDDLEGRMTHMGPGELQRIAYPLHVTRCVYEGQRRDAPERRVFVLTRSAFLGQQRYAAATWSGDIGHDWETLRRQIPAGLNFSITGQPWWTSDCGGFFRPENQYGDPEYHERFLRWLQFATFCPLQRVHGYQTDTECWRFGETVERESRRWLEFRHRLRPYTYSEAARVSFEGSTLMRPFVMDFADDARALEQAHAFMFGGALLVAPVLEPGAEAWEVYLPECAGGWVDFWTGEHHAGGRSVMAAAPLERIPLFARAGSILPLGPVMQYVGEAPADPMELRIYAGGDGRFTLYEDEGGNYNYERGLCSRIVFVWDEARGELSIGEREGSFPGMLERREFRVSLARPGRGLGCAAGEPDAVVEYAGAAKRIRLGR